MGAKIIDGKEISHKYRQKLAEKVAQLKKEKNIVPGLAVIVVGHNSASAIYVKNKAKACEELGIKSIQHNLPENVSQQELLALIDNLNRNPKIHGILVQLPLPEHINNSRVINEICPHKDVDAFHRENIGAIMIGDYKLLPCTPAGIVELIKSTGVPIEGSNCVIVGRSNIVGKPMSLLMLHENATVTICHSKTKNLKKYCLNADILVVSVGVPNIITKDMVKPGAVVIDVGMNRDSNGHLCGDVDYEEVRKVASYITPVPGGVGPMTITMLMSNAVTAAENLI